MTLFFLTLLGFLTATSAVATNADSLLLVVETTDNEIERMHAKVLLATETLLTNLDSTGTLLEQSKTLATKTEHPVEMAAWLLLSGNYNWYLGNTDSSMVNYSIIYRLDDPEVTNRRAAAAVNLASLFNTRNLPDSVHYYYRSAQELFTELNDEAGLAHTNYSIAIFYRMRNNYELALRNMLDAYRYRQAAGDTFDLIHTHNALANIYVSLSKYDNAIEHYGAAYDLIEHNPDHPTKTSLYNNLVSYYVNHVPDLEKALFYSEKSIQAATAANDKRNLFSTYANLQILHYNKGNYAEALRMVEKTAEYEAYVSDNLKAAATKHQGKLFLTLGDHEKSRLLFIRAIKHGEQAGSKNWPMLAYDGLFKLDSIEGNYLQAIAHKQRANQLKDSIWQKERADRLAELEIIYETERQEAENQMLREANRLKEEVISNQHNLILLSIFASLLFILLVVILWISRKRVQRKNNELEQLHRDLLEKQSEIQNKNELLDKQNKALESLNQTRNKFFSIISHDLKGPFNSLLGLLNILIEDSEQFDEAQRRDILKNLHSLSSRTYDLLTNLLEWSAIQRQSLKNNPEPIHIAAVVNNSIELLSYYISKKEHTVNVNIAIDQAVMADPKILQSILINLINNAIKFTHRGDTITIDAQLKPAGMAEICIKDSGVGIEPDDIDKLFVLASDYRKAGTEKEPGTGLGLITAKELVTLMGGEIRVESEPGKGSIFCFTFPV